MIAYIEEVYEDISDFMLKIMYRGIFICFDVLQLSCCLFILPFAFAITSFAHAVFTSKHHSKNRWLP